MKHLNIFNTGSGWYPFRWFIIFGLVIAGIMAFADFTGRRILSFSSGQQWNAGGPGARHK